MAVRWDKGGSARDCFCVIVTLVTLFTLDPSHRQCRFSPNSPGLACCKKLVQGWLAYLSPSRSGRHRQLSVVLARRRPHTSTSPIACLSSRRCTTFLPSASCLQPTLLSILSLNLFGAGTDYILYPLYLSLDKPYHSTSIPNITIVSDRFTAALGQQPTQILFLS
ncbi:hypothetical protein BDV93DRAFT_518145 [Ceratobasidium sp. AG-I]|nr:hypothetical protein BDV93DRAFT_518145 [Ceratobasidium sp. AG-I]